MTAALDTPDTTSGSPPSVRHPLVSFTASLSQALDRLASSSPWSMTADEQAEVLLGLHETRERLRELELRVLVAANSNAVGAESGATSTPAWLADRTRTTTRSRFRDLHLAQALDDGFEATRQAVASGGIDTEKAAVIVQSVRALTDEHDSLPIGAHERAEAHLVEVAGDVDVVTLRRLGRRVVEVIHPEAADEAEGRTLAQEEARARRLAFVTLRDRGDGTCEGHFRLPSLHAALLRKALDALTAPRRVGEGRVDPETGRRLPLSSVHGRGFMELLEGHLDPASLPAVTGSPFTLVVTMDLDHLVSGRGVATVEGGLRASAREARRLACQAGIIPLVLGGDSVPLDLGREQRLFSRYQKLALNHRYGGCAAASCDRPPSQVEYHHLVPWRQGGHTDLDDGIPLCPPHHRMADHPELWETRRLPEGTVRFHRRI